MQSPWSERAPAPTAGQPRGVGLGRFRCVGKFQLPRCCRRRPQGRQQTQGPGIWTRGPDLQLLP
eukprot:15133509-Alexandrium_andersonii.AAC.1